MHFNCRYVDRYSLQREIRGEKMSCRQNSITARRCRKLYSLRIFQRLSSLHVHLLPHCHCDSFFIGGSPGWRHGQNCHVTITRRRKLMMLPRGPTPPWRHDHQEGQVRCSCKVSAPSIYRWRFMLISVHPDGQTLLQPFCVWSHPDIITHP